MPAPSIPTPCIPPRAGRQLEFNTRTPTVPPPPPTVPTPPPIRTPPRHTLLPLPCLPIITPELPPRRDVAATLPSPQLLELPPGPAPTQPISPTSSSRCCPHPSPLRTSHREGWRGVLIPDPIPPPPHLELLPRPAAAAAGAGDEDRDVRVPRQAVPEHLHFELRVLAQVLRDDVRLLNLRGERERAGWGCFGGGCF